jgi:hypothetical protein
MADHHRTTARHVSGLIALLLAIVCTCAVLVAPPSKAQAAAGSGPYCQSVWLHYRYETCMKGSPVNYTTQLVGSGAQHSVCVWTGAGVTQCSAGGFQAVYNTSMAGCAQGCGFPGIENNGNDWNQVWGYYYWST